MGHEVFVSSPKRASEGTPQTRVPVIPSCSCTWSVAATNQTGSIRALGHAGKPGAMTRNGHASGGVRTASRRLDGLGADGAVSQAVVDEGDDLSSHGHPCDLAGAVGVAVALGDAGEVGTELGAGRLAMA